MHSFEFLEVPAHGQKITDFVYSRRRNNPVCFFSNEKGEVFYTKTAGSGTHNDMLMSPPQRQQRLSGGSGSFHSEGGGFHFPSNIAVPDMLQPRSITKISSAIKSTFIC